jgi:aspartate/methionine/tyrosine aminotransferase
MLSGRVPGPSVPNAWSRLQSELRNEGARLLDLTEANPTRVGLGGAGAAELAALAAHGAERYEPDPRGAAPAREAVAAYYRERGLAADPGAIVLTAGTSESYAHLFRMLAEPGQSFLVPAPSYPLFEPLAALEGVRLRPYRVAWDGAWHLDLASLNAAIQSDTRAIILVQPNHPTRLVPEPGELAAAEALCDRHGLAMISDEVFGDFPWPACDGVMAGDEAGLPSLLGQRIVPTFVLSGLSKVCGMPQLKLGWIAVAGPSGTRAEALRGLEWIADLFLSVGTPVQMALPRLLAGRGPWQARVRERIATNLACLRETIHRRPEMELLAGFNRQRHVKETIPGDRCGGWVAVLRVPLVDGEEEWTLELLRRGVIVHPGHFYDFDGEAYLIVSLIVEPDVFSEGMSRIEALCSNG